MMGLIGRPRSGGLLLGGGAALEHAHDVAFLYDQVLGAAPLAEQHAVAGLQIDRDQLAVLVASARAHRDDLTLRGLLLGGVRNDDAAGGTLLGVDALDHDSVVKRAKFHGFPPRKYGLK